MAGPAQLPFHHANGAQPSRRAGCCAPVVKLHGHHLDGVMGVGKKRGFHRHIAVLCRKAAVALTMAHAEGRAGWQRGHQRGVGREPQPGAGVGILQMVVFKRRVGHCVVGPRRDLVQPAVGCPGVAGTGF